MFVKESYDQLRALFETYDDPAWNSMTRYIREKLPEEADAILSTTEAIGHPLRMFAENLRHFYDDETKVTTMCSHARLLFGLRGGCCRPCLAGGSAAYIFLRYNY